MNSSFSVPELKIKGKIIHPEPPKAKIWREIMKFDEEKKSFSDADLMDEYAKKIAAAFGGGLTAEEILESVDLEDIIPAYRAIYAWLIGVASKKLAQIPNAAAPEEE